VPKYPACIPFTTNGSGKSVNVPNVFFVLRLLPPNSHATSLTQHILSVTLLVITQPVSLLIPVTVYVNGKLGGVARTIPPVNGEFGFGDIIPLDGDQFRLSNKSPLVTLSSVCSPGHKH